MIRLRTLGSVDLRTREGAQIQSVLRQPKRLAILLYLALEGPVFHRRDRLLALFWPESDEEKARGSLSQAVFQLRAALGKDAIVSRGDDEIGLATHVVWTDAREFEQCLKAGRSEDAMALYHGELLPGFLIDDAPEFDRWLDDQRSRVATGAAGACVGISEKAQHAGDIAKAIEWSRRAISIQPFNESAHQRLIALLDHTGDRAAALQAYEDLRELLKTEFESEPSAETNDLIRAVRSRAESKIATIRIDAPPASPVFLVPRKLKESRRLALAVSSGVIIIAALVWSALTVRQPKPYRPPADHVAVLFFNDESLNKDLGYLAEGLTSTLIDQLGQVRKLQVISQNGVRPFRGHAIPLDSVARQLDVGTIVGGSVTRSNDRVRVTVELTDGATGLIIRSKKVERPIGELFALLDDVSAEVSSFLRVALGGEIRLRQRRAETRNVEAWQLYQRAYLQQTLADSLEKSGSYAAAEAELASCDSLLARAAKLDDEWVEPLVMRGHIARTRAMVALVSGNPSGMQQLMKTAHAHAQAAVRLDPRSAHAYELLGDVKTFTWLLNLAPAAQMESLLEEAEEDLRDALVLTPDLPRAESRLSLVLYMQGQFEEARRAARRALEADSYLTDADDIVNRLFSTSFELGDDVEAGHWCDEVRRRMANKWPAAHCDLIMLGWGSAGSPDPRKALLILERWGSEDSPEMRAAMRPRFMALTAGVLARAGDTDSARAMLRRAKAAAPRDPELLHLEAGVHVLLRDYRQALRVLGQYLEMNPAARQRIMAGRMFRPLREHTGHAAADSPATNRPLRH